MSELASTGVAQRTVVVLPGRWAGVLPAAALPALRAADRVLADPTVPDEVVAATGATRADGWGDDGAAEVLLTADPARAADGAAVVGPPDGAALLDAVAVMDRLRSPGGCPWDAEQTHESLLQYLIEECYELYQAIEDGDREAIREELGDVLLQVLFHSRVAAEHGARPFTIDDVAADLVTKLVGRHPHVFAGSEKIDTAERQERRWDELKRAEKQRESSVDGVPLGQPAVALAAKLTSRTARAHLPEDLLPSGDDPGEQLFALAAKAKLAGVDPEAALRTAARRFADRVRAAERAAAADGADPHALDAAGWRRYWPS
ncbi:MAG TPA: MazG family protein [Pseudonocardia sp.]|jgi:XTP/dITP diphosphohydrolase|uniref:MazG family protein n=1 Tax=Pseudonocardia sp. TaxID=60912 RepID=UPI002B4AD550|nr:MazG family protein [Pseudonocardia sp.]HLU58338.1 MazG family protein [Pseudonocardia sp.]